MAKSVRGKIDKNVTVVPHLGERTLIVGQTGSGKTKFSVWLLRRIEHAPCLIYDTKVDESFDTLPRSAIFDDFDECIAAMDDAELEYIIFRPAPYIASDPKALDEFLMRHYDELPNVPLFIDELYSFHKSTGQAGPGLQTILTRGRSRGITCVMCAQRPKLISLFCLTEAQYLCIFRIADRNDKKRLGDVIPEFADLPDPPRFGFWFYKSGDDAPIMLQPISPDRPIATEYKTDDNGERKGKVVPVEKYIWL